MRHLVITPYPPYRDGIANYAVQEVAALRQAGHEVEVLSPLPSAAHHHLPLPSLRSMRTLVGMADGFDRVLVQFHPDLFFDPAWSDRRVEAVWAAFAAIAMRTDLELRLHEIDYRGERLTSALRGFALRRAAAIVVHTEVERQRCIEELQLPPTAVSVIEHGSSFTARTTLTPAAARAELGIPAGVPVFVSIGFIQPHKGFDRAVRAFGRIDGEARLYVVGDTRLDEPAWIDHCDELELLIDRTPGAEMRRGYVSDEHFDLWIAAADRVVLPYRLIWSSSVIERARVLGTPSIVTAVGGLAQQATGADLVVADDDALAAAMAEAAGATLRQQRPEVPLTREGLQARISSAVSTTPTAAAEPVGPRRMETPRLPPTPRAGALSANPLNAQLKKVVQRLVQWMVDPVRGHLDATIRAVAQDVDALDRRLARLEEDRSEQPDG